MSQQTIGLGTVANDGTGDDLRAAGDKINDNFTELYAAVPVYGAGVATFLATPSSNNLSAAVTGETGTGALVFATSPTLVTPTLTTPTLVTPVLGDATATSLIVNGQIVLDGANFTNVLNQLSFLGWASAAGPVIVGSSMDVLLGRFSASFMQVLGAGAATSGIVLGNPSAAIGQLRLAHSGSANLTTIQAGNAAAAITYTWPTNVGAAGSVLTDAAGNGTLNWAAIVGRHTVGAAAGSLFPATTAGCAALAQAETATNKVNYKYLAFDAAAVESAWFAMPTPKSYNASTVLMRAVWTHPAATAFNVVWRFEIFAAANDDALDTAVGTAVDVTDSGGTTGDFYQADVSAAITPSNTPAKQDWLFVRVSRLATSGSDTLDVDAHLLGVELYYTTDAMTDA